MTFRPLPALACCLVALLLVAPNAAAELTVTTAAGAGTSYDIYTDGSSTLAAPRNTTLIPFHGGYVIDWSPPVVTSGQSVTGYTLYRVPGPSTGGQTQAFQLPARWTATYDWPGAGTYVYFVTALFGPSSASVESVPGNPVSTVDATSYPHCNVVGVYFSPPSYDSHIDCLFPLP